MNKLFISFLFLANSICAWWDSSHMALQSMGGPQLQVVATNKCLVIRSAEERRVPNLIPHFDGAKNLTSVFHSRPRLSGVCQLGCAAYLFGSRWIAGWCREEIKRGARRSLAARSGVVDGLEETKVQRKGLLGDSTVGAEPDRDGDQNPSRVWT